MDKSLELMIQSAREALSDCTRELGLAVEAVETLEGRGEEPPFSPGKLERAYSQCLALTRALEDLARQAAVR
ncbi:MAG TPA: hypothetical protein VNO81_06675 [Candidatus Nitrosotenuis sp.]|nr:hypothetical protein [Candidatus Nitrosotenuis sp.]